MTARREDGSVILMVVFGVTLSLVVLIGAVSVTSLYLAQKRLFLAADGAALAASQSFDLASVTPNATTHSLTFRLTDANVRTATRSYLTAAGVAGNTRVVSATSPDGRTAVVRLRCTWTPPIFGLLIPRGVPLEATGRARGAFF